jgi:hypothetical protein
MPWPAMTSPRQIEQRSSSVKLVRLSIAADMDRRRVVVRPTDARLAHDLAIDLRPIPTASVNHRGPFFLRVYSII